MKKSQGVLQSHLFDSEVMPIRKKAVVRFRPGKKKIIVEGGTLLLDAASKAGLPVAQSCGSELVCGWCKVKIESGAQFLSQRSTEELLLVEREKFLDDERASCATRVMGGEVVISATYW